MKTKEELENMTPEEWARYELVQLVRSIKHLDIHENRIDIDGLIELMFLLSNLSKDEFKEILKEAQS